MLAHLGEIPQALPVFDKYDLSKDYGLKWAYIVCCQALASNLKMEEIGKQPILCDGTSLNPDDVKLVKAQNDQVEAAVIAGFTGG